MKIWKSPWMAGLAIGIICSVMTSIYLTSTAQAAPTVFSSGTIVELSSDAVVCPDLQSPDGGGCVALQPPQPIHTANNGKQIKDHNKCTLACELGPNGIKGTTADCNTCCNNPVWGLTRGMAMTCRGNCTAKC